MGVKSKINYEMLVQICQLDKDGKWWRYADTCCFICVAKFSPKVVDHNLFMKQYPQLLSKYGTSREGERLRCRTVQGDRGSATHLLLLSLSSFSLYLVSSASRGLPMRQRRRLATTGSIAASNDTESNSLRTKLNAIGKILQKQYKLPGVIGANYFIL